jgi:hypothetical protein
MRQHVATALQIGGMGCGIYAGMLLSLMIGLIVACVFLLAAGIALEREK